MAEKTKESSIGITIEPINWIKSLSWTGSDWSGCTLHNWKYSSEIQEGALACSIKQSICSLDGQIEAELDFVHTVIQANGSITGVSTGYDYGLILSYLGLGYLHFGTTTLGTRCYTDMEKVYTYVKSQWETPGKHGDYSILLRGLVNAQKAFISYGNTTKANEAKTIIEAYVTFFQNNQNPNGSWDALDSTYAVQRQEKRDIAILMAYEVTEISSYLADVDDNLDWIFTNRWISATGAVTWTVAQADIYYECHQLWLMIAIRLLYIYSSGTYNHLVNSEKAWKFLTDNNYANIDMYVHNHINHTAFFAYRESKSNGTYQTENPWKGSYEVGTSLWGMALNYDWLSNYQSSYSNQAYDYLSMQIAQIKKAYPYKGFTSGKAKNVITKESSIGLSIQETFTKESSISLSVQETHTKESSISLSVQETHTKESSIGITIKQLIRIIPPWLCNFYGISEDGRIEIFPGVFEDGRHSEKTEKIKESSIGITVQETIVKESSIGLSVQETFTKESSIGITVVVQETKESSIGISVFGSNTKESSIGITVGFPIKIEKETGILIFYGISEDGRIEISPDLLEHGNFKKVARSKIKESSIGISIQETFIKESSIGISIQETFIKESSIGISIQETFIKESSIGISIQETFIKESSIGISVFGSNTKESSIGITVIDAVLKKGFHYAKLGGIPLVGVEKDNFRISKEINQTPSFEFEIANCGDNRDEIHNRITEELEIFWQHHGKDTHVFTGIINADGIEYISLDNIQISGFASYVKLSWPFHKHLADEDAEPINTALTYNGSYFNKTTPINNATINDVDISFGGANHAFYIGENQPFWGSQIKYSTKGVPVEGVVIAIEYSTTSGWETLDVLDESNAFTEPPGTYNLIIPHLPSDWARKTVNNIKKCWLRYRIVSGSYSTEPKLDQAFTANVDVYRTYYFDTSARAILLDVLEGTGYTMDETDTCPEDIISIVAEYQSPLRLIAAIPNALSWIDTEDSNKVKAYQWWIDDTKKVHMKKRRGIIHSDDITGDMTIFNNHEDYFHLSNQLFGLGPREGLSQIRAIVRDTDSIGTHGLREIAVSEEQIANYNMLKTSLQKKIAISKDPMQRIRGSVSTQFWGLSGYEVGDTVTLHQEKWNVANKPFQIVKVDMGPQITTLDLGISQDHLIGLRDSMQRRMDFNNVQMHGSTTLLEAGPETSNYQRIDATTVYPAKLEIEIPSTVKKIHKVLLSWTLGPYRADVGPNTSDVPAHDHDGSVGDGGAVDGFNAGPDGAHTPQVNDDGAFTPQVIGGQHVHLTETSIQITGTTTDIGVLEDPDINPDAGKVLGGNHRHLKGSTGPANNVEDAFVRVEMETWCDACSEYIIQAFERSSFALGNHIHLNSNKYTGYTNPPAYVNVWSAALITSLNAYAFSKTSATETEDQAHEGVDVLAHGHAGVAVGNHSGHAIPAVPKHGDHAIVSESGGALTIDYSIYEVPGGTDMELLVNGESVGIYATAPQTEIRIDGWLNSGNNTVALQPKVGENNKKGGATLKASGLLFIEPVKF